MDFTQIATGSMVRSVAILYAGVCCRVGCTGLLWFVCLYSFFT